MTILTSFRLLLHRKSICTVLYRTISIISKQALIHLMRWFSKSNRLSNLLIEFTYKIINQVLMQILLRKLLVTIFSMAYIILINSLYCPVTSKSLLIMKITSLSRHTLYKNLCKSTAMRVTY